MAALWRYYDETVDREVLQNEKDAQGVFFVHSDKRKKIILDTILAYKEITRNKYGNARKGEKTKTEV